jgi:hypothetical protein
MPILKFIVIPTKNTYEEYSEEIVSKIKDINNCNAEIDNNYNETLNTKVKKYKKNNKNIITIGLSEVEHNTLMIHFNGTRPKTMECNEFIELLESYNDEEDDDNKSDESDSSSSSESSDDDDVVSMFQKEKTIKNKNQNKETIKQEEEEDGCIIS